MPLKDKKSDNKKKKISRVVSESESESDSDAQSYQSRETTDSESEDELPNDIKYIPVILEIPKTEPSIFDENGDIHFSANIDYPRAEYGFHHFIHANKNKTEILKQFEGKKKVYLVINRFERYVDNHEDSIGNISKKYFSLKDRPDILSRGFFKLWEILMLFDLIDINKEKFVSAHLAEGPGSFIQATMFFRDMFGKQNISKNDKYYAVTLHSEDTGGDDHVPKLEEKFVEFYAKEKPARFILHKTYTKQVAGGSKNKDNGDITDPKTIKLFGGQMDEKADLVTGDGGFDWINENIQEQEAYRLIIAQIVAAFKIQKKGGHFVCKFFETFTRTSIKLVAMLSQLYEKVYFVKPLMSRPSNSEKYVVCTNFKYDEKHKEYKNISKKLDDILSSSHKNKNKKIVDIFTQYAVPVDLIHSMTHLNRTIANYQLKSINEIMLYVKKEVYSGDEYHERRQQQIEGSKYWINLYYPEVSSLGKSMKIYKMITEKGAIKSKKDSDNMASKLIELQSQNDTV
jgi:hypothetical protein